MINEFVCQNLFDNVVLSQMCPINIIFGTKLLRVSNERLSNCDEMTADESLKYSFLGKVMQDVYIAFLDKLG